jgi:hypothetical protein
MGKAIVRIATPSDVDAVCKLGLKALEHDAYEGLVIDRVKVYALATECISSAAHFANVVEKDGEIVGALCAMVHPILFYEKNQATVLQYYCSEPGAGIKMLRAFMQWVKSRHGIKFISFTLESNSDPRIGDLLKRFGMTNELPVYFKVL